MPDIDSYSLSPVTKPTERAAFTLKGKKRKKARLKCSLELMGVGLQGNMIA